ncbi:MAG: SEC10/PgrA surface exclusion domain-containing protein [Limosilactobacillus sp.]|uniref:SEC10/PgrA surface exclusion domain-containing protein n=1 Tax=Limosilactobacillus sp. TaxID=2773925 RepID=UPI0026F91DB0|nr:SEC10/PgrA surface exclusion domain-containing protein [Limosilactobacillus sp.]
MKDSKKILAAALVAGAATVVTAQNAHADGSGDSYVAPETPQEQSTNTQATTTLADAKTQADSANATLADAQKTADQAKSNLDSANKSVSDAQDNLDQANKNLDHATEVSKNASPEAITDAQGKVATAKDNVTKAQSDAKDKTTAQDEAQKAVYDAQSKVAAAQTAVDQATKAVNDAQSAVDGTSLATAQKALDDAKAALAKAQAASADAPQKLADATKALNDAQAALDAAKAKQADAQSKADATQKAVDDAQAVVNEKQKVVDSLRDKLQNVNTMTLPAGYKEAILKFHGKALTPSEQDEADAQLAKARSVSNEINQYRHSATDAQIKVDYKNLTYDQRKELSLFIADLINQLRRQMGYDNDVFVTPGTIDGTKEVTDTAYNQVNWDAFGEHLDDGKSHNLDGTGAYEDKYKVIVGECLGSSLQAYGKDFGEEQWKKSPIDQNQTMDSVKQAAYETLRDMVFDDRTSAWGHTLTILGIDYTQFELDRVWKAGYKQGFGVDYDKYGYAHFNWFYNYFDAANKEQWAKYADNKIELPSNTDLQSQFNSANNDLGIVKANLTNLAEDNLNAHTALTIANSDVSIAQIRLNSRQEDATEAKNANEKVLSAIDNATKAVADAQATVDSFTGDQKTKLANLQDKKDALVKAQQALTDAQADLKAKQDALATAKADLETANKAVTDAQTVLDQANKALADLQNAPQLLADAQKEVETAKQQLADAQKAQATAQTAYEHAKAVLSDAQIKADKANQTLAVLQAIADAEQKAEEEKAQAQQAKEEAEKAQAKEEATKAENAKIEAAKVAFQASQQKGASQKANTLPQTGNNLSTALMALGVMGAMLGMSVLGLRKRN